MIISASRANVDILKEAGLETSVYFDIISCPTCTVLQFTDEQSDKRYFTLIQS